VPHRDLAIYNLKKYLKEGKKEKRKKEEL